MVRTVQRVRSRGGGGTGLAADIARPVSGSLEQCGSEIVWHCPLSARLPSSAVSCCLHAMRRGGAWTAGLGWGGQSGALIQRIDRVLECGYRLAALSERVGSAGGAPGLSARSRLCVAEPLRSQQATTKA